MSRIAHSVYYMKDDERTDFLSLAFRAADFCGLKLLGWCIMTNHFHLLVYLPLPETLTDEEVRARYAVLVGPERAEEADVGALRRRMYDVGEYMKIVKQSFTEGYNRREDHSGTMWEAVYKDKVVPRQTKDLSDSLCYQHLNPIRAAITPIFTAYPWSSLAAFVQGDARAVAGMRFVYGEEITHEEMLAFHCHRMSELLEEIKLRRAEEIARKRAAGYEVPCDHLTTEAMVAQVAAHLDRVQRSLIELNAGKAEKVSRAEKTARIESLILAAIGDNPKIDVGGIAERIGLPQSTVYRHLGKLKDGGRLARYDGCWRILK